MGARALVCGRCVIPDLSHADRAREDEIGCLPVGDADHDRAETADLLLRRDPAVPRMRLAGAAVVLKLGFTDQLHHCYSRTAYSGNADQGRRGVMLP